ncbi:MAG: DJ-1/PfpI family protein [Candidatus Thorarchaeota archaeon]
MQKRNIGWDLKQIGTLCLLTMMIFVPLLSTQNVYSTHMTGDSEDQVRVLFIMDHDYGANYHYIRPILESYGWNITLAGTAGTLTPCDYQADTELLDVDLLISQVTNISYYDAISIMPGESHALLLGSATVRSLIQNAVAEGLVVSAWCKAVRVLADADVIDGKNVTGSDVFVSDYEAAGATYMGIVPPVIDGNIVTGVRSRFYRVAMCQAIATALGVYEENPPTFANTVITPLYCEPFTRINVSTEVFDETGISFVYARIFEYLLDPEVRIDTYPEDTVILQTINDTNVWTGFTDELDVGNYTVDFRTEDVFENDVTYPNVVQVIVEVIPTTSTVPATTSTAPATTSTASTTTSITSTIGTTSTEITATSVTTSTTPTSSAPQIPVIVIAGIASAAVVVVIIVVVKKMR